MLQFRRITNEEYSLVKIKLLSSYNIKNFETLIAPFKIIVGVGKWKEVLLVPNQSVRIFQEFREYRNPYFMGIHLGDIKKDKFKISLEGITLISKSVEAKTVLTNSGEKTVLYGRDLTKQDLLHIPPDIQKNDFSILMNNNIEVLALGKYLFDGSEIEKLKPDSKVVRNIIDKGWYLRKGR